MVLSGNSVMSAGSGGEITTNAMRQLKTERVAAFEPWISQRMNTEEEKKEVDQLTEN